MNEYLSKEYVLSCVNNFLSKTDMPIAAQYFYDCFRECKAADVQPVRRGKWIGDEVIQCSICNFTLNGNAFKRIVRKYFKYCPNCGARMDGDTE